MHESGQSEDLRSLIFSTGYNYFKNGFIDLSSMRTLNQMRSRFKPKTLEESLDLLSYQLLSNDMNTTEKNTLKLVSQFRQVDDASLTFS